MKAAIKGKSKNTFGRRTTERTRQNIVCRKHPIRSSWMSSVSVRGDDGGPVGGSGLCRGNKKSRQEAGEASRGAESTANNTGSRQENKVSL